VYQGTRLESRVFRPAQPSPFLLLNEMKEDKRRGVEYPKFFGSQSPLAS
jgi:hypothetical protein